MWRLGGGECVCGSCACLTDVTVCCICGNVPFWGKISTPLELFCANFSQLRPHVEVAQVSESDPLSANIGAQLVESSNRKEEKIGAEGGRGHLARPNQKGGEKCAELCGLLILRDVFIFLCPPPPPTPFNVCHLRDSRGPAPVCLLARSPQIPPPAPACHSCCRASWGGGSVGERGCVWWKG